MKGRKAALKEINDGIKVIEKMFEAGGVPELTFYRTLLTYAFDYTRYSYYDKAMALLLRIPESYYQKDLQDHLDKNEELLEMCSVMLKKLRLAGYGPNQLKINVPAASA